MIGHDADLPYQLKKQLAASPPAFDVTPAEWITAIITDRGIAKTPYTDSIKAMFA